MNVLPGVARITTNTAAHITPSNTPIRVFGVHLVSIPTSTTLTMRNGAVVGATAYAQIDGAASQAVTVNFNGGLLFPDGVYCSTDVNLSWVNIIYSTEH